jgi:hypothetical protein
VDLAKRNPTTLIVTYLSQIDEICKERWELPLAVVLINNRFIVGVKFLYLKINQRIEIVLPNLEDILGFLVIEFMVPDIFLSYLRLPKLLIWYTV